MKWEIQNHAAVENATFHNFILLNFSIIFKQKLSHILIIILPKYFYFCDQILYSKTFHFIDGRLVSKSIQFTIGINNWWIHYWSTFLWLNREEKYMWADLSFLCTSSLMWWFGQRILSKLSSIEKEGNLWIKKRKTWRKIQRRPHVGNCAEVRQIRPSTTEDRTPIIPGQL